MEDLVEVDIIILSYAQTEELRHVTLNCIKSLIASESQATIKFHIIVIESEKKLAPYQYPFSTTIYSDRDFGYNRYMNIGIEMTDSSFICICNNDLIFHPSWASEMLKPFKKYQNVVSASPFSPLHHSNMGFEINTGFKAGYRIRYEVAGWCLFFRRSMIKLTGKLDENYRFWCADNDYANTLHSLKLTHILVTSSVVDHLESKTLLNQTTDRQYELTEGEVAYFDKKWKHRLGRDWYLY